MRDLDEEASNTSYGDILVESRFLIWREKF